MKENQKQKTTFIIPIIELRITFATAIFLLILCSSYSISAESVPEEVDEPKTIELPCVYDQVKKGHWLHGINWPWDNYGSDFGKNSWGYRGLANQGPSGWRREIRETDNAAKRLFSAKRNPDDFCMGIDVEQKGPLSNAIIYFYIDDPADKKLDETIDLSGQTISADIFLPGGIEGPNHAPSGVQLFFQDEDWTWADTDWKNLTDTDQWITLSANPDELVSNYIEFDPSHVRSIGVKLGTNEAVSEDYSYTGHFYVDNIIATQSTEIQFDYNTQRTRTENEIISMADQQVKVLRWWIFCDCRAGLVFDENGFVTGLDNKFMADLDEVIRLARSSKVYLVPVLFDFLMGGEGVVIDGVLTYGHAELINDPEKCKSLLDNAIAPFFDKIAGVNEVLIIDLFNEPEWLLLDSDIEIPEGKRPSEIEEGGVISLSTMKIFFSEIITLYKQKASKNEQLITIGSARPRWVTLWKDLEQDIAQFHLWNGPGQIDEGLQLDFDSPIQEIPTFIGEFSTLSYVDTCKFLESALALGY